MSPTRKVVLMIIGAAAVLLIIGQLVMGQMLIGGQVRFQKAHQHSGYTAVVVTMVYFLALLVSRRPGDETPARRNPLGAIAGSVAAALLLSQVVLGQLILDGRKDLIKVHQHTGYTTVAVCLIFIGASLIALARTPARAFGLNDRSDFGRD